MRVPIAVPCTWRKCLPRKEKLFLVSTSFMRQAMSLRGGDVCPALAKATEQARIPSSCGIFVYRDETSNVPMMAVLGIWPLIPFSFCKKSGLSWMYDGT